MILVITNFDVGVIILDLNIMKKLTFFYHRAILFNISFFCQVYCISRAKLITKITS